MYQQGAAINLHWYSAAITSSSSTCGNVVALTQEANHLAELVRRECTAMWRGLCPWRDVLVIVGGAASGCRR